MGKELEVRGAHPVPALFERLGIERVTPKDKFTITYDDGLIRAVVKRKGGKTETTTKHVTGNGFQEMSVFDPDEMSKKDRNALIRKKYKSGEAQASLAETFGLSQAMISRIVNP